MDFLGNIDLLKQEIAEKTLDLEAFTEARARIQRRVLEVRDSKSQLTPLPNWSGTDACLGSLDLAVHSIERTVEELKVLLEQARGAAAARFTVIDGGGGE